MSPKKGLYFLSFLLSVLKLIAVYLYFAKDLNSGTHHSALSKDSSAVILFRVKTPERILLWKESLKSLLAIGFVHDVISGSMHNR
jgi:hypothetical protein